MANGHADLSPQFLADIDQLIAISGMVIRTSQLIPEMQEAFFQCQVCAHTARVEIDRGRIAEPSVCERCHTTHSMALIHNRSVFSDKQMVCASRGPARLPLYSTSLDPQKAKFNRSISKALKPGFLDGIQLFHSFFDTRLCYWVMS